MSDYVVKVSTAKMPSSCWGKYKRVAVLEVEPGTTPKMISTRACGVRRVVRVWEKLNVGDTARCAYRRALVEANTLAEHMSAEGRHA